MANNRFTNRTTKKENTDINLQELLLTNMQREFPDDAIYQSGNLTATSITNTIVGTPPTPRKIELESRNDLNILSVVSGSMRYVEYKIDKYYPTITEDDLDELIDDEWEYFIRQNILRPVTQTGLFLINTEIELNPVDFHYAYIARGPAQINSRVANGESLEEVVRTTFCVFYVENGVALPIPNYQTLEVLLVERGLTYDAIREATAEQIAQFDMTLDGSFIGDRTATRPADALEEFEFRQVLDRSRDWNYRVRFDSGYRPKAPFQRDPGDYLKPVGYQGDTGTTDLYLADDPLDLFFDLVFQKQTYKEKLREKYEGKMIVGLWPVGGDTFDQNYVDGFTSNIISDGLPYLVRIMINGFWKQVIDDEVFRLYANINNFDITSLAPRALRSPYTNFIENSPDGADFISGERGFINLLVQNGGIDALQGFSTIWSDFPHIVEADRLDINEYKEYIDNYSNSNNVFDIDYLKPYEPAGSTAYYPTTRILALQQQVTLQQEIEALRASILEYWPVLASQVASLDLIANSLPANYNVIFNEKFGSNSPLYKIITTSDRYKYIKKKRNGFKVKDDRSNLLEMFERNERISAGAFNNPNDADRIVGVSNWGRVWSRTSNTNFTAAEIIMASIFPQYGIVLLLETLNDLDNIGENELPRNTVNGRKRGLMKDSNYAKGMVASELAASLQNLDLLNRTTQADDLIVELREAIAEAKDFIIEIDDLIVRADSITEFQDIYTRIIVLNTTLSSFNDDGLAFCDQVRADIDSVFKVHLDRLYKGVQYFRQRVHDEIGNRSKFGIEWAPSARAIIEQYLPGKTFDNYLPSQE